ncbi:hypothetical protein QN219_31625 [Sinorhizobium sp. 7-81]|uniref:hypothetical protein n=1 Tax=Sinorhizobium sp. 8-89 TaxID=3049089 RepID=UPI0024C35CB2|nr:hypothetical protein [Sinorhizobium sp. 8-89]MDK1494484.1 hypothetical protein [Sinorhizobium sp. 8-89]
MNDTTASGRPLHLQTIDSLFAELIGGASVSAGENQRAFRLEDADSRKILNWYRVSRSKWAGKVMAADVDAIASSMLAPLPNLPIPEVLTPATNRRLKVARVIAHRFAGLHSYGTVETPPADFVFEPREPITLFEG